MAYAGAVVSIGPGTAIQTVVDANPAGTTFVFPTGYVSPVGSNQSQEWGQLHRPNRLRAAREFLSGHFERFEDHWEFSCL